MSPSSAVPAPGWVDAGLLAVLAVSLLLGLWRGLVFELMALLGWVVAYFAAQWFAPQAAALLPFGAPGSALNQGAGFAGVFIAALVGWSLLARLVRLLVHATPLTLIDRVLGAAFGLVRGGVLLLALATLVALTPAARAQPWQDSRGAAWLLGALQGIKPVLPLEIARHLPG